MEKGSNISEVLQCFTGNNRRKLGKGKKGLETIDGRIGPISNQIENTHTHTQNTNVGFFTHLDENLELSC